jgi:hypothetical protein
LRRRRRGATIAAPKGIRARPHQRGHLYRSDFQDSGTFNLLLVVKFKNNDALAPTKARYDAFMKEWGAERNKKTTDIAQKEYPAMRDITGEYAMREITFK